jgi:hypothetical protein
MVSSGMLRRVALVRTDVSEELSASFIRVTRIGELGTLVVTSNRRTKCCSYLADSCHRDEGGAKFLRNVGSYKSQAALTHQKTPFFIVTAVKTSNLAYSDIFNWLTYVIF